MLIPSLFSELVDGPEVCTAVLRIRTPMRAGNGAHNPSILWRSDRVAYPCFQSFSDGFDCEAVAIRNVVAGVVSTVRREECLCHLNGDAEYPPWLRGWRERSYRSLPH
jgi:hypothetical protein